MDIEAVATYEAMRLGRDRRYGLWALPFAMAPHLDETDPALLRAAATEALRKQIEEGNAYLFMAPFAWGREIRLDGEDIETALADDRNWKPRRILSRALVRVGATGEGAKAFAEGHFGPAPPVLRPARNRAPELEMLLFTRDEFLALAIGLPAFGVGAALGGLVGNLLVAPNLPGFETYVYSQAGFWGIFIGGFVGFGIAIVAMRKLIPEIAKPQADTDTVIVDHYMEGPSLNPLDEVGNPRF